MTPTQNWRRSFGMNLLLLYALMPLVFSVSQLEAATKAYGFIGAVTALPGTTGQIGDWMVGGKTVHVSSTTVFPAGEPASITVGTLVDVDGTLNADGTVTASSIAAVPKPPVKSYDFSATVTALPGTSGQVGTWAVGGKTVDVTSSTVFPAGQLATIAVGSTVDVHGILNADGSITALRISLQGTPPGPPSKGYDLQGAVTALPGTTDQIGNWTVAGVTVIVSSTTLFPAGQPASITVGTLVDVDGTLNADGTVTASSIAAEPKPPVKPYFFTGTVTALPGTSGQIGNWTVGGKTVSVTASTMFPSGQLATIAVGSAVDGLGILNADGSITALWIALQGIPPTKGYDVHGAVTALPGTTGQIGDWTVAGVTVIVSATTVFPTGQPASITVGTVVDVNGTLNADGTVTASRIAAEPQPPPKGYDFTGTVTALPGTSGQIGNWTVGGKTVDVTSSTVFPAGQLATIVVGSMVEIDGVLNADGSITALRIAIQGTLPGPPSRGHDLHGVVTSLPGTTDQIGKWTVAGVTVIVSAATVFPAGQPASITVGTRVDVDGTLNADGTFTASRIDAVSTNNHVHRHSH